MTFREVSRSMTDSFLALFRAAITALPRSWRALLGTLFIWFVRWQVDGFWTWLQWRYWMTWPDAFAQDRRPVTEGVAAIDWLWYGPSRSELVHRLTPEPHFAARLDSGGKSKARAVLYVHGGGFVFASSSVLLHSVTLFCRQGFTVYSMDYPMAPEHRFPTALLSVLAALHWLRVDEGVEHVVLLGDSAGANLVSMAAAFILNPPMMKEFAAAVARPELVTREYPRIESMALLYGLLDQTSWRGRQLKQISVLENFVAEGGIAGCLELYRSLDDTYSNRLSLMDICDDIEHFPRTLFIGGSQDPLVYSTVVAHKKILDLGFDAHCKIYPARHGFFGFPPQWTMGAWRHGAAPAAELLCDFFRQTSRGHRRRCSLTDDGISCCLKESGDFGHHALLRYDRHYGTMSTADKDKDPEIETYLM